MIRGSRVSAFERRLRNSRSGIVGTAGDVRVRSRRGGLSRQPREASPVVIQRGRVPAGMVGVRSRVQRVHLAVRFVGRFVQFEEVLKVDADARGSLRGRLRRVARLVGEQELLLDRHRASRSAALPFRGERRQTPPPKPRIFKTLPLRGIFPASDVAHRPHLLLVPVTVQTQTSRVPPQVRAPRRHRHLPSPRPQELHFTYHPRLRHLGAGKVQSRRVVHVDPGRQRVVRQELLRVRQVRPAVDDNLGIIHERRTGRDRHDVIHAQRRRPAGVSVVREQVQQRHQRGETSFVSRIAVGTGTRIGIIPETVARGSEPPRDPNRPGSDHPERPPHVVPVERPGAGAVPPGLSRAHRPQRAAAAHVRDPLVRRLDSRVPLPPRLVRVRAPQLPQHLDRWFDVR
mmetsp:Transcript_12158/g.48851  ORF Transcript_12158/g.48851 Transcript_12158/m.48851 type:complete len:400 (+) Transcript_12158:139-1338(+)